MTDLHDRLQRLGQRARVSPAAWHRFSAAWERHERHRRVAAGSFSLVVALGGILGVWQAFHAGAPATRTRTVTGPVQGAPFLSLWPQRSVELGPAFMPDVGLVQREADEGNPEATWQLSPAEVATRFATDVLNWPGADVSQTNTNPDGSVLVIVHPPGDCYEYQRNSEQGTTSVPPVPWTSLSPVPCSSLTGGGTGITLAQPGIAGGGGIWEVVEVHPEVTYEYDLGVRRGQTLHASETLRFDFADVPPGAVGLVVSFDCAAAVDVTGTIQVDPNHSISTVQVPADLTPDGEGCTVPQPANGYVYAYSTTPTSPPSHTEGDPFKASGEIGEVAIVPVVFSANSSTA